MLAQLLNTRLVGIILIIYFWKCLCFCAVLIKLTSINVFVHKDNITEFKWKRNPVKTVKSARKFI